MKKKLFLLLIIFNTNVFSQIQKVEPPFWWTGMKLSNIQLLVYGNNIGKLKPIINSSYIKLISTNKVKNKNYMFLNLEIDKGAQPGFVDVEFYDGVNKVTKYSYQLKERNQKLINKKGFNSSDVMYLITPDRFVNGDPNNDEIAEMKEKLGDGDFDRHGGDLQGIINHLDYIDELGFTCIWLNPALENDMKKSSYHGYSTTDYYKTDLRFGSNEMFKELSEKASEKGIKIIMDIIPNHCGSEHWFFKDPPTADWFNNQNKYKNTTHNRETVQDIHASQIDKIEHADGWFVETMPDLNQRNPFVSKYFIQNAIWWIEYANLSGLRVDTYPYSDKNFMSEWTKTIMDEYPEFNIVGEEWSPNPAITSYWQKGKVNHDGYVSYLTSLMDFPLQISFSESLNDDFGWGKGFIKSYKALANDFLYTDPYNLVIFPDNHDITRFYTQVNNDLELFKMGIAYYATMRGIPQFYYGTEILMNSNRNPGNHGVIRSNFPGGFLGDKVNAFTGEGLNKNQIEVLNFFKNLLNWRKNNDVIHNGNLIQFAPKAGGIEEIYSYYRCYNGKKVWVIFNRIDKIQTIELDHYGEAFDGFESGYEILSQKEINLNDKLEINGKSVMIIELGV
ncbi:MAG: alpha-amlyase [Flavobacteriaceae bacterium TMED68]|nr:MAG: alpha-amlyase [Flavobacteriaceae bacterium TMED68]|tara:strand:+ start:3303 stop:5153 length:1851 start_codon:yes stop_codon:yes gene_type:complete